MKSKNTKEETFFETLKKSVEEVVPCPKNCANCHYKTTSYSLDACCHEIFECPCEDYQLKLGGNMKKYSTYQDMVEDIGEQDGEFVWNYLIDTFTELHCKNLELEDELNSIKSGDILGIVKLKSDEYMGTVEHVDNNIVIISKETWAPGLWAGCENVFIDIISPNTNKSIFTSKVINIDLTNRIITFDSAFWICVGDILRLA